MPLPQLRNVITSILAAAALLLGAASGAMAQAPTRKLQVFATFTILADMARQVGGERVEVTSLVGPNADLHTYRPTPADARRMAGADIVLVNGLGFESFLPRLIRSSGTKAQVVTATTGITPRKAEEAGHEHGHSHGHGHAHGAFDPHAWQSPAHAATYVANIREALIARDPAGREVYQANAARYLREIEAMAADIRQRIDRLPAQARVVITTHDAFGYFAQAFGLEFRALKGVANEAEPSARDMAAIIRQIKASGVRAVFLENVSDERLMRRIAAETGARVGGALVSDALTGADGVAPTYIDMMRHNAKQIADALTP